MRTRIKICCIADEAEARLAAACGADVIGLVGAMPSGPGVIDLETAARANRAAAPGVSSFLLTSAERAADIAGEARLAGTDTVQIVRHVDPGVHEELARIAPGLKRVQVIHVEGPEAIGLIAEYEAVSDAFLLDSGRPGAAIAELGGTGRAHDWSVSAAFVRRTHRPVWLAGGLNPGNAADAVRQVAPFGLDICSGVRRDGRLDPERLRAFVRAVQSTPRPEPA